MIEAAASRGQNRINEPQRNKEMLLTRVGKREEKEDDGERQTKIL
jgi:hypothetical protein